MIRSGISYALGLVLVGAASASSAATVGLSYRYADYDDNATLLDSTVRYDPADLQGVIDELDSFLRNNLGPDSSASIRESRGALSGEQADYELMGGSFTVAWPGDDENDGLTTELQLSALVGDADVRNEIAVHSIVDFDIAGFHVEDVWTTSQQTDTRLRRLDLEATLQHSITQNFALIGGLRYERIEAGYSGRLQATNSRNLENLVNALSSAPLTLDLTTQEGSIEGDVTFHVYSARLGVLSNFQHRNSRFFLSMLMHYDVQPDVNSHSRLTPFESSIDPIDLDLETADRKTAGIDFNAGYAYEFLPKRAWFDLRYRATTYYDTSGPARWRDPRVNHGLYTGMTFWFKL